MVAGVVVGVCVGVLAMVYFIDSPPKNRIAKFEDSHVVDRKADGEIPRFFGKESKGIGAIVTRVEAPPLDNNQNQSNLVQKDSSSDDSARRMNEATNKVEKLYGPFLAHLAQQGRDAGRFRALLIERQMITSDILAAGRAEGIDVMDRLKSKPLLDLMRKASADFTKQIRETVGENDYGLWTEWELRKPDYNVGLELNRRLNGTGFQLTLMELEKFAGALYETKDTAGRRKALAVPDADGVSIVVRVIQQSGIDSMRTMLSPQQYAKLLDIYREQQSGGTGVFRPRG